MEGRTRQHRIPGGGYLEHEEPPCIVVVDDERHSLDLLDRTLRRIGRVFCAQSGEEGWAIIQREHPSLVVTDQRMPGMNGSELLGKVAALDRHCGRVLLTGYSDLGDTVRAINEGGVHAYVAKPWQPEQLIATVKPLLERVQLEALNAQLLKELAERNEELELAMSQLREVQQQLLEIPSMTERTASLHELVSRNVVGSATGLARQLSRLAERAGDVGPAELRDRLGDAVREAERIARSSSDFLALRQADKGKPRD